MPGGGVPLGQHDLRLGEGLVDLLPVEDAGHVAEGGHVAGPAACHVSRVNCHVSREEARVTYLKYFLIWSLVADPSLIAVQNLWLS